MLLAISLIVVALSVYLSHNRNETWRMILSWWRKTAQDEHVSPDNKQDEGLLKLNGASPTLADGDDAATPKAKALAGNGVVPALTLDDPMIDSDEDDEDLPPPQFPALNSAQRASGTIKSADAKAPSAVNGFVGSAGLMAPPPRPSQPAGLRPPASNTSRAAPNLSSAGGLRVPTSGPLPNRGPPRSTSSSLQVHLTTSVAMPNPRKKIALAPGHSPLDWAHLQRTNSNLAGVDGFQKVTPSRLKLHNGRKGRPAWASYQGKVYNITPYLPFHPGGEGELRRCAGKDGEKLFMEVHPWVNWDNMLGQCLVGILVSENDMSAVQGSPLDEMD